MIDIAIRNFVNTQNISESESETKLNGSTQIISPHKKDTFSNKLMKKNEINDIHTEKEENKDRTENIIGTFFMPFVEAPGVIDSSYLGNLNDVGELLQEISQQAFFFSGEEEIYHTTEILPINETIQVNTLLGEFPFQEEIDDSLQLLVKEFSQIQNETQSIEKVEMDWDREIEEEFEEVFFKKETDIKETDINKRPVEFSTEQFVQNELSETGMTYEKTTLSNLADKLQQKIDHLQKFVVKTDKAFIQLNPENLGKVDIVMEKIGDKLMIEVDVHEQLAKKSVEVIFEDLQARLQEKSVEVQLSFTEREAKEQEEQQKQEKREQKQELSDNKVSKSFDEILGGAEDE